MYVTKIVLNKLFFHVDYITDFLPPSMTCNIGLLSDFFSGNNDVDDNDWFLEDLNNIMINKVKNTFDNFGKYNCFILNLCNYYKFILYS